MSRPGLNRGLNLESLESRELMAGDVKAVFSKGALSIKGDDLDNAVLVFKSGSQVVVAGVPDAFGENTIVNGIPVDGNNFSAKAYSGVKSITFNMNEGNDSVGVTGVTLDSMSIKMDDVNDFGDDLVLIGGDFDILSLTSILYFQSGGIPVDFINFGTGNVVIRKNLSVDTGLGDDLVAESALSVAGTNSVSTGDGNDNVLFNSFLGRGTNAATLKIDTGLGNDGVDLTRLRATTASIDTSVGFDVLNITDSSFKNLKVQLSAGDDTLNLDSVSSETATLDGGSGNDAFTSTATSFKVLRRLGLGWFYP